MISSRSSRAASIVSSAVILALLMTAGAAFAHSELKKGEPEEGVRLENPPRHAYLTFTEAPAADSAFQVLDGCGRNVVTKLERFDVTLHAKLRVGQPGAWQVRYDVISDEDGHESKESYAFTVKGKKDCSADEGPGGDASGTLPGEESDFPIVPIAIGTLVIIAGAIAIRIKSSG